MNLSCLKLFQTCKDTKFESNSQHTHTYTTPNGNCFRRAKIQNLRAIHNMPKSTLGEATIVSDVQRYKIWEQFTTASSILSVVWILFQTCKDTKFESNSQLELNTSWALRDCFRRAKIQNLRAIHNTWVDVTCKIYIVSDVQRYKIWEQFTTFFANKRLSIVLFQTCKDTKFESNSQLPSYFLSWHFIVSDVQRYKIWEQFTTFVFAA